MLITCACVRACARARACVRACARARARVCVCVCRRVSYGCVCACMYVRVYLCIYLYISVYLYFYVYMYMCTPALCTLTRASVPTIVYRACAHIVAHGHAHSWRVLPHALICAHSRTLIIMSLIAFF